MKDENKLFFYFGRQNGKYNLSLEQLLEKIKEIQKLNSINASNRNVFKIKNQLK